MKQFMPCLCCMLDMHVFVVETSNARYPHFKPDFAIVHILFGHVNDQHRV